MNNHHSSLHAALAAVAVALALGACSSSEPGFADTFAGVEDELQRAIDDDVFAGAVMMLSRPDESDQLFGAYGVMDIETGEAMRTDAIFRMASMTKPVTAVAALILVDEGRMSLDDPIATYLPEWSDPQVLVEVDPADPLSYTTEPAQTAITVRHLLTHTAGVSYRLFDTDLAPIYADAGITDGFEHTDLTLAEESEILATLPLLSEPGSQLYYGLSQDILGRVIEVVAETPLDAFISERIFTPLGMSDSHFFVPQSKVERMPALHRPAAGGGLERVPTTGENAEDGTARYAADFHYVGAQSYVSGGAGMASTADDFLTFLQMLYGGGEVDGTRILEAATVAEMVSDQTGDFNPGYGPSYGFGIGVQDDPALELAFGRVGTYYWAGIFYTRFWVDPQEQLIGILLTQQWDFANPRIDEVKAEVYAALDSAE